MRIRMAMMVALVVSTALAGPAPGDADATWRLDSPDGRLHAVLTLVDGVPRVELARGDEALLLSSALGLDLAGGGPLRGLRAEGQARRVIDTTWRPAWGPDAVVRDQARELRVRLREAAPPRRRLVLVLRACDDGFAFRYELPAQAGADSVEVRAELTELRVAGDPRAWWIPADEFAYESLHRETPLSRIDHAATPLTMVTAAGTWLCLHEAELLHWPELSWKGDGGAVDVAAAAGTAPPAAAPAVRLRAHLWPWPDGIAVKGRLPLQSPWRVVVVGGRPGDLATSHLVQNLCAPCALDDTSWLRPLTFCGIWWGLHTGRWTWEEGPRHGATTERAKQYLDFAARAGLGGVLAEGWNPGWETWGHGESRQDYTRACPDFDLAEVVRYARERGVAFIGHHETGGNIPQYEAQLEAAFALCERLGIHHVKTGYAGVIVPAGMHHHGQYMVEHFQRVVETAARHRVALDVHEGIKPTGLDRTWPNLMSTEAVRGQEHDATLNTLPPRHVTILPYTRFVAGPADFTPGLFRPDFAPGTGRRTLSTVAAQLALYVVQYSPLMMVADLPENCEGHPGLRFLAGLPTSWDETRALDGWPGECAAFARRRGDAWYVGAVTDEQARVVSVPFDFLAPGQVWRAELFADARGTAWDRAPALVDTAVLRMTAADTLRVALARAGGVAVRLRPWREGDGAAMATLAEWNAEAPARCRVFAAAAVPGEGRVAHLAVGCPVTLRWPPSPRYDRGALNDGRVATSGFTDDAWLGFEGVDLVATLDRGASGGGTPARAVVLRALHEPRSWILLPAAIVVEASDDGAAWTTVGNLEPAAPSGDAAEARELVVPLGGSGLAGVAARWLRVTARQRALPPGHPGHGKAGWVFVDEVQVR